MAFSLLTITANLIHVHTAQLARAAFYACPLCTEYSIVIYDLSTNINMLHSLLLTLNHGVTTMQPWHALAEQRTGRSSPSTVKNVIFFLFN